MNNNEVCFEINSKKIFLDKVLVEYNKTPVFFVCNNSDNEYFIALCTDIDSDQYIVVKTNIVRLLKLFKKNITMREIILAEEKFWEIEAAENFQDDKYELLDIQKINNDVLPYVDSYFEVLSKELKLYFECLENKIIYSEMNWQVMDRNNNQIINETHEQSIHENINMEVYTEVRKLKTTERVTTKNNNVDISNDKLLNKKMKMYKTTKCKKQNKTTLLRRNISVAA